MLRQWVPIEKLNLLILLLDNSNPMAISFFENGWYIKKKRKSGGGGGGKRKKMSIDSITKLFFDYNWAYYLVILMRYHY